MPKQLSPKSVPGAADRDMIDKWAACLPERRTIEVFWEWLRFDPEYSQKEFDDIDIQKALDKFQHIDRKRLERQRSAMLDKVQSAVLNPDSQASTPKTG